MSKSKKLTAIYDERNAVIRFSDETAYWVEHDSYGDIVLQQVDIYNFGSELLVDKKYAIARELVK